MAIKRSGTLHDPLAEMILNIDWSQPCPIIEWVKANPREKPKAEKVVTRPTHKQAILKANGKS